MCPFALIRSFRVLFLSSLVLGTLTFTASGEEGEWRWPGLLGPKRDGWVGGFKAPAPWPERVHSLWEVEVGEGYGTPLVAGNRVYQHARQGDDEVLWCLDLETGAVKWRKTVFTAFKIAGGGEFHGKGPKSCPVLADGRVFTMSITGVLTAWDADSGKLLWRRDDSKRYDRKNQPHWGVATSPIVDGDQVVVHFGNDDRGELVALDVETGKELWTHGKDGASYSSPLVLTIAGVRQIVEWNHRALVGVESGTGRFLWEQPFPHVGNNQNMPTPTHHEGTILLGGENRGIHCFVPRKQGDGSWSVSKRWSQEELALDMSTAVINDGLLYGMSHYKMGRLFCLDPTTGEILWQSRGRVGDNVAFLAVPGFVLALIDRGELQVIQATGKEFKQVVTYEVAESPTWAPPVLLKQGFLIKDKKKLTRWSFSDLRTASR